MPRQLAILLLPCCLSTAGLLLRAPPAKAEVTAEDVREAIRRGAQFLKRSRQQGNQWPEIMSYDGGVTSLCTLALLNAGYGPRDPDVAAALQYLRKLGNPESTYATSLQTMAFCAAEPKRDLALILRNVRWLEGIQFADGPGAGGWGYRAEDKIPDESNTQFALLALHEAALVGVPINPQVLRHSEAFWKQRQHPSGAWDYRGHSISGSMTCAGIGSMIIINTHLREGDARVEGDRVVCCGTQTDDDTVERGIQWLARNFSVTRNPSGSGQSRPYLAYYLYGLERVGRLSGRRFIGQHDWYREGADFLVNQQNGLTGGWSVDTGYMRDAMEEINTAMVLLFLSKGKRPVLMSKLQHTDTLDWNRHRHDVAHLSQVVEQRWRTPLTWQTVNLQAAGVDDLLQSPVLFLSGRDSLRLTVSQKRLLHDYVMQGGFLFAEAACEGEAFDRAFRNLMQELFPDRELRLLPPDHPVWRAEMAIPPEYARPLYGLDSCCRTSVVYCPRDLGCYWELAQGRQFEYPPSAKKEIDAVVGIGINVLAYATGRELRDKLDVPLVPIPASASEPVARGSFAVAKLAHGGGSDEAPAALPNLVAVFGEQLKLPVRTERRLLPPTAVDLADYPLAFIHGRRSFRWNDEERAAIAAFLQHGGVLFGDAICGSEAFAEAFRREIQQITGQPLRRIPADHPMFTPSYRGYDIRRVQLRQPQPRQGDQPLATTTEEVTPYLEGVEREGVYQVIFSPHDLSCALENYASLECRGYSRSDAARIGVNVMLYALQP